MITPRIELLAPAGDAEKMARVIQYGADAVYLGLNRLNLRAAGKNFAADEQLAHSVAYAHDRGVKVYVALNSLLRDHDFPDLREAVRTIKEASADAVIVSDPGVLDSVRQWAPELAIHISTQASVCNARTARFWYGQGVRRIILARELSLAEIRQMRAELPADLELEAFVHGAMCVAWSGRCLLSAYYNQRSANRGACTQPCRWKYQSRALQLTEAGHSERPLELAEDEFGSYLLSSSDLCMIEYLPQLIEAGISSLKIEGRTKSAFYAAVVVKVYREALDRYLADPAHYEVDPNWLETLEQTVHRHFDTGFYFVDTVKPLAQQQAKIHDRQTLYQQALVVAEVRDYLDTGYLVLEQKNKVELGDQVELIQPRGEPISFTLTELYDLNLNAIDATPHARMIYLVPYADALPAGSFLRKRESEAD